MSTLTLAVRSLRRTPFVTAVALLSLALGIGANAAIFSLFDQFLLKSLPVSEPGRLVNFGATGPVQGSTSCNNAGDCDEIFSYPMFKDLEQQQTVLTGLAAHRSFGVNLAYKGDTVAGQGMLVSGSYFPVLGLTPALGRLIGPTDDAVVGQAPVVVLSHDYWQTRFGASAAALNETLIVNGVAMTVVGVAPSGFTGTTLGTRPNVFVPITMRAQMEPGFQGFDNRRTYWAYLFGRLKPGVSLEQASAALNAPYHNIINEVEAPLQSFSDATMKAFRAKTLTLKNGAAGQSSIPAESATPLTFLLGVTVLVLLIACANIANLMLARAAARSGEMAVRLSIGASRWSLVRQLLVESLVLSGVGGALGLLVARGTLLVIRSLLPGEAADLIQPAMNLPILGATAVLAIGTGLVFGMFPALYASRPNLVNVLKGQAGQPAGAKAAKWFRLGLATLQIWLAMTLLGGSALFLRSLVNISRVDLGLETDHLITFGIAPELNGYSTDRSRALFTRIEEELAAQPGITSVSGALVPLLAGNNWGNNVSVEAFDAGLDTDTNARYNEVGPGYLKTLGVPLMAGREFTAADTQGAPKVAIVNEKFVEKFGLGHDAVGKHMGVGRTKQLDIEIIGVAQNAKYSAVKQEVPPLYMMPYRQQARGAMTFYVRTTLDPEAVLGTIRPFIASLDPNLPVEELRTMDQQIRENVFLDRLLSIFSSSFAVLATLLAAIGLYGVLAYTVSQRTREFGLRMALGAAPHRLRGLVMRQVGWMVLIGGTAGVAVIAYLAGFLTSVLYQLQRADPLAIGLAAGLLAVIAFVAGFIPAFRASRLDPMKALRYE